MKDLYLEILKKIDVTIFQNYNIIDGEEYEVKYSELERYILESVPIKIELLVDFHYYEPIHYNSTELCSIDGWFWEFFSFNEGTELYDLLAKVGINDAFWKTWLKQSWGSPEYIEIWDGNNLYDEDFFDNPNDALEYLSVWKISGTMELILD